MRLVTVADVFEGRGWPGHPTRGGIRESPDGVAMVQLRDVDMHRGVDWDSVILTSVELKRTERWVEEGDILFAARGARLNATVARDIPGQVLCSPHFFHLRVRPSMALPDFIAWQMNQSPFQNKVQLGAEGVTSLTVRIADFRQIPLALPPLDEQETFAALYRAQREERRVLEGLIENRERQMKGLATQMMRRAHLIDGVSR